MRPNRQTSLPAAWAAFAAGLAARARRALAVPVRAARTDTGRRVLVAALATLALAGIVRTLYDRAETPARLPTGPVAATRPTPPPTPAPTPPAAPAGKPVKPTPEEAAVAFYAAELQLPADRVRPLMQQRVNDNTVRVLVLAERGPEDLPTRLIQVNRTQTGWRVP